VSSSPITPQTPAASAFLKNIGGVDVYTRGDLVYWTGGLQVDADGSPRAYNPKDTGLDALANAGRPGTASHRGNWWGILTDNHGEPVVQGAVDPAPGFYISTTSLSDGSRAWDDPRRFVDAETVPYIVIPPSFLGFAGKGGVCRLGDLAVAVNLTNGNKVPCIVADVGPSNEIGEGSIALAQALEVPSSPRTGGCEDNILIIIFSGSHTQPAWPRSLADINASVAMLVTAHHLNLPNLNA